MGIDRGDYLSRRRFLEILTWLTAAVIGMVLAIPVIGYFLDPIFRKVTVGWSEVGPVGDIKEGEPKKLIFNYRLQEGYFSSSVRRSVWAVKVSGQLRVYSPVCPHLGCEYSWSDIDKKFECPCHASIFSIDGRVLGGPSPRPLDDLNYKIENNILFVQYENFRVGTSQKVRA